MITLACFNRAIIDSYIRRAKARNAKETTNDADDVEDDPDERPPIEAWYSIVHEKVPSLAKKDDFSNIFAEILCNQTSTGNKRLKATDEAESFYEPGSSNRDSDDNMMSHELNPNYEAIRLYLADILRGKYPPELSTADSLVVLSLIEKFKVCLENCDNNDAHDFLKKSLWWNNVVDDSLHLKIGDDTGESDQFVCTAKTSTVGGSASQVDQLSSTSASPSAVIEAISNSAIGNGSTALNRNSSDEHQQQTYNDGMEASPQLNSNQKLAAYREECINYTKIKRIYACLNPLSVPVDLLVKQHNELRAVMSELSEESEKYSHIISNSQNVNSP